MHRIRSKLILCTFLFLFLVPIITPIKAQAATTLNTFQDNPIEYWSISEWGTNSLIYHQNNTVEFTKAGTYTDSIRLYAVAGTKVFGTSDSGDYSNTLVDDSNYWSETGVLNSGSYKSEFYVWINVTDYYDYGISELFIQCNGRITSTIGVSFYRFQVYNNNTGLWTQVGSNLGTSDTTQTLDITISPYDYIVKVGNSYYIYVGLKYWKSVAAGIGHYDYCHIDVSYEQTYPTYNVTIPIIDKNDITVKTMLEYSGSINYNTNISITFVTTYGDITNINFTIDATHFNSEIYRIEYNFKKAINIFRITISDVNQYTIYRSQQVSIISKDITEMRIDCNNIPTNGKLIMYYLSGDLEYTIKPQWNIYEITASNYDEYSQWHYKISTSGAITTKSDIIVNVTFSNFQYIRSYLDEIFYFEGTIDDNVELSGTYITIKIGNVEFSAYIRTILNDGTPSPYTFGWYQLTESGTPISSIDPDLNDASSPSTSYSYINAFKLWRTLDDRIGLGISSDNNIWRDYTDDRNTIEDFTYSYTSNSVSNFAGNITIEYIYDVSNSAGSEYQVTTDFSEMEYDFTSDFGIAEPHFSSTWFDLFGRGLETWFNGITTIMESSDNAINDLFDWLADLGNQIYNSLSPSFDLILDGLDVVSSAIGGAAADIIDQLIQGVNDLGTNIGDWLAAAAAGVFDALVAIASSIADFLVWFVNGIGSLMGITDLAGSFAELVSNFVDALAGWIGGFGTMITILASGIAWAMGIVATYAPLAAYILLIVFVLSILGALVSMDFDIMKDVMSFWVNVAMAFGNICYQIANAVIQFIGGVIP